MSYRSVRRSVSRAALALALGSIPASAQAPPPQPTPAPPAAKQHEGARIAKGVQVHHEQKPSHPSIPETPKPPVGPEAPPDLEHRHHHSPDYVAPPVLIVAPPPFIAFPQPRFATVGGGLMLPVPSGRPAAVDVPRRAPPRPDPTKSEGLVTIGDRLFRAGNTKRAAERYEQARKANPKAAKPRVRLAQVAIARGDYKAAAELFRGAMTAEPGWLVNADDIQAIFAEPGDFARMIGKLETHLQANPRDRDGWLVLGAELFLSGKTRQASDVFARLNDRRPDTTLAAFLDATTPDAPPGR